MSLTTNVGLYERARKLGIHINQICFKDELPSKLKRGFYIINMQDADDGNGTHWVALAVGDECYYFDSFGIAPPREVMFFCKKLRYSTKHIQNINGGHCGEYCLAFLKYMNQYGISKKTYYKFLRLWDKDPEKNLKILMLCMSGAR